MLVNLNNIMFSTIFYQIVIVFFAGILIAQILYSFGLSIDVSMMGGTAGILTLAFISGKGRGEHIFVFLLNIQLTKSFLLRLSAKDI